MVALSEVAVDIVASGDEARFRDLMEAHHYLGALLGNLGPKALQRFRVRRRDGQYRAPSLTATTPGRLLYPRQLSAFVGQTVMPGYRNNLAFHPTRGLTPQSEMSESDGQRPLRTEEGPRAHACEPRADANNQNEFAVGSPFPLAARITAGLAVASNIVTPFYGAVLRLWMAALFFPFQAPAHQ